MRWNELDGNKEAWLRYTATELERVFPREGGTINAGIGLGAALGDQVELAVIAAVAQVVGDRSQALARKLQVVAI